MSHLYTGNMSTFGKQWGPGFDAWDTAAQSAWRRHCHSTVMLQTTQSVMLQTIQYSVQDKQVMHVC